MVSGKIIKRVTSDIRWKGYIHHASREEPQYIIQSGKSDHLAIHKVEALHRVAKPRKRVSRKRS